MLEKIRAFAQGLAQTARLMVGVRDYETYQNRDCPPDTPVMSREDFVRACQNIRYSGRGNITRCPC